MNRCRPTPLSTKCALAVIGVESSKSSVMVAALDDEPQQALPVAEQVLVAELPGVAGGVGLVHLRLGTAGHPVVANARPPRGRFDVDGVRRAGRPVPAPPFAVLVLTRRPQALGQLFGDCQRALDQR